VSPGIVLLGVAIPLATALASVARSLIRHCTERRRLDLVERLAARHGIDAVSTLSKLIPPQPPTGPGFADPARRLSTE
jgi:hypothetical protein